MTLTDPREALADESNFIGYLLGLAGLARVVRTLAADGAPQSARPPDADDFVHVLLGLASLGELIERLGDSVSPQGDLIDEARAPDLPPTRWLR